MSFSEVDVAIIGAGPYGLSLSTQLTARGVEHRIFGPPMHAWATMSPGMNLKSFGWATNIYTPRPHYTLPEYCAAHGLETVEPIEIATFARYGVWVQRQLVPHLEPTTVTRLGYDGVRFSVELATGETVRARRVVSATGLTWFERLPAELEHLPAGMVIHTAHESNFDRFAGKRIAVIGAGQSALQAAALLHEHGAETEIYARGWGAYFSGKMPPRRSLRERLLYPNSVLGPGRENWVLQHFPALLHHLPDDRRVAFTRKHLGPAGAWWLRDRVEGVIPIHAFTPLRAAAATSRGVRLRFTDPDGADVVTEVDHVIAGTGYEVNLDRVPFLDASLRPLVARLARAPRLSRHFESSVPGLYFAGPATAMSFGPLFRFVAGAEYTTPVVVRHLARLQAVRYVYPSVAISSAIAPIDPIDPIGVPTPAAVPVEALEAPTEASAGLP